ncbi:MAG: hypothetical protein GXP39_11930 [Chloroflexi bacterium]|nr:hypothetical protein [Chloroflexota bacterium]
MRTRWWMAALLIVLWMGACAPPSLPTPTPTPAPSPTPAPARSALRLGGEALVEQARESLAERLGLSPDQIEFVSVTSDEMALEDLGCPTAEGPRKTSPPALVIGQEIIFRAGGQEYVLHSDGRRLILCRAGEEIVGEQIWPEPEGEPTDSRSAGAEIAVVAQAVADLAERLRVTKDTIQVRSVEMVEWPDTSLGCPEPGKMYAQVITPGYRIVLEAQGKAYEYHASQNRVVYCAR